MTVVPSIVCFVIAAFASVLDRILLHGVQASEVWLMAAVGALAAGLFAQARGWPALTGAAFSIPAAALAAVLMMFQTEIELTPGALIAGLVLACMAAPLAGLRETEAYWIWNVKALFTAFLVLLGALLGWAALNLLITGVHQLFNLFESSTSSLLMKIANSFVAYGFGPILLVLALPRIEAADMDAGAGDSLRRAIAGISTWALAPFVIVYAVMLWLYALKILLAGVLPNGEIGWMVGLFAGVLIATVFGIFPQRANGRMHVQLLWRYWPWLLAAPLVLFVLAVRTRIAEYGLSSGRYFAIAFAASCAAGCALALTRRERFIKVAPAAAALLFIVGSFGPWGARGASQLWEIAVMREILSANGQMQDGVLRPEGEPVRLSESQWALWSAAFDTLSPHGKLHIALGVADETSAFNRISGRVLEPERKQNRSTVIAGGTSPWLAEPGAATGLTLLAHVQLSPENAWPHSKDLVMERSPTGVVVTLRGGLPTSFETRDLLAMLNVNGNLPEVPLLGAASGDVAMKLLLESFEVDVADADHPQLRRFSAYLFRSP